MKKKLVVLLAVVMMFAFSASAYAVNFSDIDEQPVVTQDAISKLVALGIIEGYENGTFAPDATITRAEFAKIAVTAAGAKDTAEMLKGNASAFPDVKKDGWYIGWVNASESLGIFQGDANGNFRPNDTINNQEVLTVMLRLLGYNDNLTGTWPVNYVTQANKLDILDDVNIVANEAATRGSVATMMSALLDENMVTYDKDTNEFVLKQNTISDSAVITLLDDSFKGTYIEVADMDAVTKVKDAAKETLTWDVTDIENDTYTMIIDKDTEVSYNAGSLFSLEGHQGKVYFVEEGNKVYARFIEVESYIKTVTDTPAYAAGKVTAGKTTFNAVATGWVENLDADDTSAEDDGIANGKNSKYLIYFNDDDQAYAAITDQCLTEKTYIVKSVGNSSVKLIGNGDKTQSMKDADTLIWNGTAFIAPSELQVGDAIMEITAGELYVMQDTVEATLTKTTEGTVAGDVPVIKYVLDGKTFVAYEDGDEPTFYDQDLDVVNDITDEDEVFGNKVEYVLNKDNSIAAVIVDEVTIGTKLYGVIVGAGKAADTSWTNTGASTVDIFTAEGKTVTYEFDEDYSEADIKKDNGDDPVDDVWSATNYFGNLVEYKLNANGEIKELVMATGFMDITNDDKIIDIEKGVYLVDDANDTFTLTSGVVLFEVDTDQEDNELDVTLVTRSALLSNDDFQPGDLPQITVDSAPWGGPGTAFCQYIEGTAGVKAMAYTVAGTSDLHFAVADGSMFHDKDHTGSDWAVKVKGDDTVYDWESGEYTGDDLIAYTLSGAKVTIAKAYKDNPAEGKDWATAEVASVNDGMVKLVDYEFVTADVDDGNDWTNKSYFTTTKDTVVYVLTAEGDFEEAEVADLNKGDFVHLAVVDKDCYAELVIIDEYRSASTESKKSGNLLVTAAAEETADDGSVLTVAAAAEVSVEEATITAKVTATGDATNGDAIKVTVTAPTAGTVNDAPTAEVTLTYATATGWSTDTVTVKAENTATLVYTVQVDVVTTTP